MKVIREQVSPDSDSSFRILLTPGLNDQFYWHFHPEYEIVFIDGATGTRHIGDHISRYEGSDLVFIGPNIPHLNFDYGVRTDCSVVVVQMREDFLGKEFFQLPEMSEIRGLFERARKAVYFTGETKRKVGEMLGELPGKGHFEQLMGLLGIFQVLAASAEAEQLNIKPMARDASGKEQQRMRDVYRFVEENYQRKADSTEAAALVNLTPAAFCRYFKRTTGQTFTDFMNQYRITQAKKFLMMGKNVTETCFECGFENLSHFNRSFRRYAGENPSVFRKASR
jgi:AraC-like DNA-binding protein